jgi:hypothetical protein
VALFLVARGSARAAEASTEILKESTLQARSWRKTLREHDDFLLKAVNANLGTLYTLFREDHVRRALAENGMAPYLGEADSRIRQEIRAVASHLNITPEQAAAYMRTSVRPMEPEGVNDGRD